MRVTVAPDLTPAGAERLLADQARPTQAAGDDAAVLVLAPWLSTRTRAVFRHLGASCLDLTGHISLRLDQPAIRIELRGADKAPTHRARDRTQQSVDRVTLIIRELVDTQPPRRLKEIADSLALTAGAVSRLLDGLDDEGLIEREVHRIVTRVDWQNLLRMHGKRTSLAVVSEVLPATHHAGKDRLLNDLRECVDEFGLLATGPFAARAFGAPNARGPLMLYFAPGSAPVGEIYESLRLLPADRHEPDLFLLRPKGRAPFHRVHPQLVEGIPCVGPSQLVIDCLGGPGSLPETGEAVLGWMASNRQAWQAPTTMDRPADGAGGRGAGRSG